MYQKENDNNYVVLFIRGDYEVNEAKLKNILGDDVYPAEITNECGLVAGFIGAYNLNTNCEVLFDKSLENTNNLICGANKVDYHYIGFDISRDICKVNYVDVAKVIANGICPNCKNKSLEISRGIEVGNIFQLGTKYTKAMDMTYLDENGESKYPIMGCYGIGIGRLAASVCEAHHDEYGPIWPMPIAPWQVHLCAVRANDHNIKELADKIYNELVKKGIEVIYDDRNVSAGVMFSDADLLGVPLRVIISPRNLKENCCEIVSRDKKISLKVNLDKCINQINDLMGK